MTAAITVAPNGLQLERSRIAGGEPGLTTAENVKCARPGLIEPRGSFQHNGINAPLPGGPTVTVATVHARRWDGVVYSIGPVVDASGTATGDGSVFLADRNWAVGVSGFVSSTFTNEQARSEDCGDRLAWTLEDGLRALDTDQTVRRMGTPRAPAPYCTLGTSALAVPAGQNWLANDRATAYRAVFVQYRNGVPMFGAPSDRVVVRNFTGSAKYVSVRVNARVAFPDLPASGTLELHIYRSPEVATPYSATPSDEMRLRFVVPFDSNAQTVELVDYLGDDAWSGPTIYTAETQQGGAQANYRPASALDVAHYNGMTFYAGHESTQVIQTTLRAIGPVSEPQESLCSVVFNGDATTGSDTIVNVTANVFPYLAVGQVVTELGTTAPFGGDATFPADTRIVSFDAGAFTITLSANATATATLDCIAWDWVGVVDAQNVLRRVAAQWYDVASLAVAPPFFVGNYFAPATPAPAPYAVTEGGVFAASDVVTGANPQCGGGFDMERAWAWAYPDVDVGVPSDYAQIRLYTTETGLGAQRYILLRWETYGDAPTASVFQLRTTKPNAIDVAATSTTGVSSTQEGGPSILAVSKVDEPEALPLVNTFPIGKPTEPIVRAIATTDSLWVWKTDGLFRVYGDAPESLTIQQVDPTCRALAIPGAHRWITRLGDTVYGWSTMGLVSVSQSGVRRIDGPIQTEIQKFTPTRGQTVTYPTSMASLTESTVAFGFRSHTLSATPLWFVYTPESDSWQTWTFRADAVTSPAVMVPLGDGESPDGRGICGSGICGWADYVEDPRSADEATPEAYPIAISDTVLTGGGFTQATIDSTVGQWCDYTEGTGLASFDVGDLIVDADGVPFWVIEPEPDILYVDGDTTPVVVDGEVVTIAMGELKLDRDGIATGLTTAHRWAQPSTITYAIHMEGLPIFDKFYRQVYTHCQTLRGGRRMTTSVRAYNSTVTESTESTYSAPDYLDNPREYLRRVDVPREQTRAPGVAVTLIFPDAAQSYELGATAVTYEPTSDRTASPYV